MRFGKSAKEAEQEPSRGGVGGDFIKYLRDGDTTFRILQDPDDWTYWWEHFNPSGFSFPCPRSPQDPIEDCPGCRSDNERMSKVTRRVGFNVLSSFNGQEYVNVYKVASAVADKLKNRYSRFGTVTDRDYTITRYKTSGDRYDFDVDGGTPTPVDPSKYDLKDIEAMLAETYEEQWGDGAQQSPPPQPARTARPTIAPAPAQVGSDEPPFEPKPEKVYREEELRKMEHGELLVMIKQDMNLTPPATLTTTDGVVNWLMELNS